MTYPSPPSYKIPYDVDGTYVFWSNWDFAVAPTEFTLEEKQKLNNESTTWDVMSENGTDFGIGLVFPEALDIDGLYISMYMSGNPITMQWSADTTDGFDGTWTNFSPTLTLNTSFGEYRTVPSSTLTSVKGIRFGSYYAGNFGMYVSAVHVYGVPTQTGLHLWHPTLDQRLPVSDIDLGVCLRGQTLTKDFRVKNTSALTATSVNLTTSILTDSSSSFATYITYSYDSGPYTSTVALGDLAPGAITPVTRLRYSAPYTATLGPWAWRVALTPTGWT